MKNLKWILIGAGILIVLLSMCISGYYYRKAIKQEIQINSLDVKNDFLTATVHGRDISIEILEKRKAEAEDSLIKSQEETKSLKSKYRRLEADYNDLSGVLNNVPVDSSYSFLLYTAYPFTGYFKYPFNADQVKAIHLTFLQKESLLGLRDNLSSQVKVCERQLGLKDTVITALKSENTLMVLSRKDMDKIIINKDAIIGVKDKEIKQQTRRKNFWKFTTAVAVGLGVSAVLII